jgi:hypothetical protein
MLLLIVVLFCITSQSYSFITARAFLRAPHTGSSRAAMRTPLEDDSYGSDSVPSEQDHWFFSSSSRSDGEEEEVPPSTEPTEAAGYSPFIGTLSQEYASLAQTQFDLLAATMDASRCALGFRRENRETGELEFATVAVYPPKKRVWLVDEAGRSQKRDGPLALPGFTAASVLLPQYPFVTVSQGQDGAETSAAVENDDGGLSAPLVYGSLVIGMLTVWRDVAPGEAVAPWTPANRDLLEKVATSLAIGAALDQRQRWAAASQVSKAATLSCCQSDLL